MAEYNVGVFFSMKVIIRIRLFLLFIIALAEMRVVFQYINHKPSLLFLFVFRPVSCIAPRTFLQTHAFACPSFFLEGGRGVGSSA